MDKILLTSRIASAQLQNLNSAEAVQLVILFGDMVAFSTPQAAKSTSIATLIKDQMANLMRYAKGVVEQQKQARFVFYLLEEKESSGPQLLTEIHLFRY